MIEKEGGGESSFSKEAIPDLPLEEIPSVVDSIMRGWKKSEGVEAAVNLAFFNELQRLRKEGDRSNMEDWFRKMLKGRKFSDNEYSQLADFFESWHKNGDKLDLLYNVASSLITGESRIHLGEGDYDRIDKIIGELADAAMAAEAREAMKERKRKIISDSSSQIEFKKAA